METGYLYHYTTQAGLMGILESNCLWATHYKFLNDYTEMTFAKDELTKALVNTLNEEDTKRFHEVYGYIQEYEIYTTSFCKSPNDEYIEKNGLLSQWRGYGSDGGFAILFDKVKIEDLIEKENQLDKHDDGKKARFIIDKVIYSHNNDLYLNRMKTHIDNLSSQLKKPDQIGLLITSFLKCIGFYKSEGFKEENEYRILASLGRKNSTVKNRKFLNKEKPYIELFDKNKLDKCNNPDRSENEPLPIKGIIVGPHKDKEMRAARLRVQLAILNRGDIPVTISETPFIG
jgi:hypothetical protein